MLIGQFRIKVGEKGRIAFPKRFRDELGDKLIATYGFEGSLIVVSEKNWRSLLEGSENKPFLLSETRDIKRFLLGGATLAELDRQGRFILPDYLREYSNLRDEVVFVGQENYVEVWSNTNWKEYEDANKKKIAEVAEKLVGRLDESK